MSYQIEISASAEEDLAYFTVYERKIILECIIRQLTHEPFQATANRKSLRENRLAPWELRCGNFRVFYTVEAELITVIVVAVGQKEHNTLYIRGKVVIL